MEYKQILPEEVNLLARQMKRERVAFNVKDKAQYLGAFDGPILVGVVGWQFVGSTLRYKVEFVIPERRKTGIYRELWSRREEATKEFKGRRTAFCTSMSLPEFLKRGFSVVRKCANGITFVENEAV